MTHSHTVQAMTPLTNTERRRLLVERAEYHERLAAQLRRLVILLAEDPPDAEVTSSADTGLKLVR